MRRVRHRFHAARHDALRVARFDRLGREHYGLEPRAADLVDGERRNRAGETGVGRGRFGAGPPPPPPPPTPPPHPPPPPARPPPPPPPHPPPPPAKAKTQ